MLPPDQELPPSALRGLFDDGDWATARRIETRTGYLSDTDDPRYGPVMRDEPIPYNPTRDWYVLVGQRAAAGRRIERVRVVDDPLTAGQKFLVVTGAHNVAAGERIRLLPRVEAQELDLRHDVWLFDGPIEAVTVTLRFDDHDDLLGVVLSRDAHRVEQMRAWWAAVWPAAADLPPVEW